VVDAAGTYDVHMTASGDGVTLTWVGASCGEAREETQRFDTVCVVSSPSQLIVTNPCSLCVGDSVSVAFTVDKR
jgi:hypothetical protein